MRDFSLAMLASLLFANLASAQSLDAYALMPNAPPSSLAVQSDGRMLIAGSFNHIGTDARGGVARLETDGSLDPTFADPAVDAQVNTIAVQPDGKLLIGGSFTSVGGQPRHSLARLEADGSLDTSFVDPALNSAVWALALQPDGRILAGGSFTQIGSHAQNYFARLDANGNFDGTFADPQLCCDPLVNAIALQADGRVLIGGAFSEAGGSTDHFYFARYSPSGVIDASFPATAETLMPNAIAVAPDGSIYIQNGTSTMRKLDANGTPVAGFANVANDGSTYSFALQPNGKIVIGGTFQNVDGQPRHALARLDADGSLDASFRDMSFSFDATNAHGYIYAVAAQADGHVAVVGNFTLADAQPRQYVARVAPGSYATSALVVRGDGASVDVTWYRLGDGPELGAAPTLMHSADGMSFTAVGPMSRVANGWHATANFDVHGPRFYLQAVGAAIAGANDASPGEVASTVYSSDTIFANGFE